MTKFTINHNGKTVFVLPDYHISGKDNGPLGWIRLNPTEETGVALAVGGYTRTAQSHSLTFTQIGSEWVSDFRINGEATTRVDWEAEFLKACDAVASAELLQAD